MQPWGWWPWSDSGCSRGHRRPSCSWPLTPAWGALAPSRPGTAGWPCLVSGAELGLKNCRQRRGPRWQPACTGQQWAGWGCVGRWWPYSQWLTPGGSGQCKWPWSALRFWSRCHKGIIINAIGLCVFYKLMDQEGGVVGLHHHVAQLEEGYHVECVHDPSRYSSQIMLIGKIPIPDPESGSAGSAAGGGSSRPPPSRHLNNAELFVALNEKYKTIKYLQNILLRRNHRRKFTWPWFRQRDFRHGTKRMIHKGKNDKLNFIKTKNYPSANGTVKWMKRQEIYSKKMFVNQNSSSGIILRILKFSKLNNRKRT